MQFSLILIILLIYLYIVFVLAKANVVCLALLLSTHFMWKCTRGDRKRLAQASRLRVRCVLRAHAEFCEPRIAASTHSVWRARARIGSGFVQQADCELCQHIAVEKGGAFRV